MLIESVEEIASRYNFFLVDIWGVLFDGDKAYPGVSEKLKYLSNFGEVVLFSNTALKDEEILNFIESIGVSGFSKIVTAGVVSNYFFKSRPSLNNGILYNIGDLEVSQKIVEGSGYSLSNELDLAEGVLISEIWDSFVDDSKIEQMHAFLYEILPKKMPIYCAAPDIIAVGKDGRVIYGGGKIAHEYLAIGGDVVWFGKPYPMIYSYAIGDNVGKNILAIGDGIGTDIKGASSNNIDSLFLTCGVHAKTLQTEKIENLFEQYGAIPTYFTNKL